jgi:hypothetical protein
MDSVLKIDALTQLRLNLITMEAARHSFETLKMPASVIMMSQEINQTRELIKRIENDNTK